MKNQSLTVEQVMQWKGQISKDNSIAVVRDNQGNSYAVKSKTEYVAGFLSQLENGEALIAANQPQVGVRSIKGKQIDAGKYQVVSAVRVLFDTTQALETSAALITLPFASVAPVQFKNGEFKISQGTELFATSGTDITNFKASTGNDDDFRNIVPVVLRGGVDASLNIKLAGVPAAGAAFKIEIRSTEFTLVGQAI